MVDTSEKRIVLLNHLRSRSTTRAKEEAPIHAGAELLSDLLARALETKWAIEFEGLAEDKDTFKSEDARIAAGLELPALRLRTGEVRAPTKTQEGYFCLLFEHLDPSRRSLQVVNIDNHEGREIEARKREAGCVSAHVVIQVPKLNGYDERMYRCVLEPVSPITRSRIEWFLSRQVRRLAPEWTFPVTFMKKGKPASKSYHYTPKLELLADVSRKLGAGTMVGRKLSHLVFTKRETKQSVGQKTRVKDTDFLADVTHRVGANQGPPDEADRLTWAEELRAGYESIGWKARVYFRSAQGDLIGGSVQHRQLEGAQDLLLCPKEYIEKPANHKQWSEGLDNSTVNDMIALIEKDSLWEHTK